MADTYYTISQSGEAKVTEKMSRFLAFAHKVSSAEEARECIKAIQNRYHDARHVCWAYMIGPQRLEWQLNDNGEPSGTAGKPILGQINSAGVTDVVVAVVRYFGGIKLGTSGLIAAYREAARQALEAAGKEECHTRTQLRITFPYLAMQGVMKIAKGGKVDVKQQSFDNVCTMVLEVRDDDVEEIRRRLADVDGVQVEA